MPRRSELAEDKGGCCETADQLLHSQTSALDKFACVLLASLSRCLGAVSEEPQSLALLLCDPPSRPWCCPRDSWVARDIIIPYSLTYASYDRGQATLQTSQIASRSSHVDGCARVLTVTQHTALFSCCHFCSADVSSVCTHNHPPALLFE